MSRWGRQRGAISPAAGIAVVLLSVTAVGGIAIGRMAAARQDAQQAADSAVLAAADIIRERGMPFDNRARSAAETLARRNSKRAIDFQWSVTERADRVEVAVATSIDVDTPLLAFREAEKTVAANAVGQVSQTRFDEAERRLPKLVLVLDYSGSMSLPFSGGGARAIDVLEDSVEGLLNADLMIEYGAAFYSSGVFRTHGVGPGAPAQIVDTMSRYDAGGVTNTAAGITTATNVLRAAPNTGRYILLVSDGEPCCASNSFSAARAAAARAWGEDVTIFTLEIRRRGSSSALDRFMTDVAGSPTSRGDRNYHFVATTAADLIDEFENIVANIVCKVGPLNPVPADLASMRVFMSNGLAERPLPATGDLAADRDIEAYRYNAADRTIRLTERACDAVIDRGDDMVVRFDRPTLTD